MKQRIYCKVSRIAQSITLRIIAAFNNSFTVVKQRVDYLFLNRMLIDHVYKQYRQTSNTQYAKQLVQKWVNQSTEDGFLAVHFGAYRGNIPMVQYLSKKGSNLFALNKHGMNALHIAAQGDQPAAIVYFRMIGLDMKQRDIKGGSPLHWAAFYGCEQAVNYLTSFPEVGLNTADYEGLTPLHLSAMSGHSRIVKKLLVKGCQRSLQDKKGMTAADIASQNEFHNIEHMLRSEENCIINYFNVRMGMQPAKRSKSQLVKFILMYAFVSGSTVVFIFFNDTNLNVDLKLLILFLILQVICFSMLVGLWHSDPGRLGKHQAHKQKSQVSQNEISSILGNNQLLQLLTTFECFEVCPECVVVKAPRSRHCDICQSCIKVYDHHCPWVDNCVYTLGTNNHFLFYMFVLVIAINITIALTIHLRFIIQNHVQIMSASDWNYTFRWVKISLLLFSLLICAIFVIPLWFLFAIQTKNLFMGRTTYERYSLQSQIVKNNSIEIKRKRHLNDTTDGTCTIKNCYKMCFLNRRNPSLGSTSKGHSLQLYSPLIEEGDG